MSLAELKRRLQVGTIVTMTQHSYDENIMNRPTPLLDIPRKVKVVQSNAIQFEPHREGSSGSWLYWPKSSQVMYNSISNEFTIILDDVTNSTMKYKIGEQNYAK